MAPRSRAAALLAALAAISALTASAQSALAIPGCTMGQKPLAKKDPSAADAKTMHAAWVQRVLMQTILWSHPCVREGRF